MGLFVGVAYDAQFLTKHLALPLPPLCLLLPLSSVFFSVVQLFQTRLLNHLGLRPQLLVLRFKLSLECFIPVPDLFEVGLCLTGPGSLRRHLLLELVPQLLLPPLDVPDRLLYLPILLHLILELAFKPGIFLFELLVLGAPLLPLAGVLLQVSQLLLLNALHLLLHDMQFILHVLLLGTCPV
jgi:hypothetical protein